MVFNKGDDLQAARDLIELEKLKTVALESIASTLHGILEALDAIADRKAPAPEEPPTWSAG